MVFRNLVISDRDKTSNRPVDDGKYRIIPNNKQKQRAPEYKQLKRYDSKQFIVNEVKSKVDKAKPTTEMEGQLPVTQKLKGILNLSKNANLDDTKLMRSYMMQKGVPLLDCVGE